MSPSSSELEMELEISSEGEIGESQEHAVHEYAFGIMSSDTKGMATIVGMSEPYKKRLSDSESSYDEDINRSWSMCMYQSLYKSGFQDGDDEQNEISEDDNNNLTIASSAPERDSCLTEYEKLKRSPSKAILISTGVKLERGKPPLSRRWTTNGIFGGGKASPTQQARSLPRSLEDDGDSLEVTLEPTESWFSSITNIPDKIRQHRADKNRFNVKSVPREQLKQLHCY